MGFYEERVLPRVIDVVLGNRRMQQVRRPSLAGLSGTVVELGFGSGPNVPLYPAEVDRVLAVEPSARARELAQRRIAASSVEVTFVGLDGQSIPIDDRIADCVLSTWTLCTIPDVDAALAEVKRVLKPGGRFFFLEHGLSTDPKVARWQHRLTPIQRKIAGGCHLDRDIEKIVRDAGFGFERYTTFTIGRPKVMNFMYTGVATKAT
ncbi:MAG: class I SAM-dependent methyltransferase [Acidimicrobiales bacterium]|nr:class I SAM-dependent methyltransferase [Acidimicrobiales bacterium]